MDAIAGLLDGPRARGAFLLRSSLDPPWALRVEDRAPLCIVAVVRGSAWIGSDDGDTCRLGHGDLALIRGPDAYVVADAPGTPPQAVCGPDQLCTSPGGALQELGVRTWGTGLDGETVLLTGTYLSDGEVSRRLLRALPTLVHLPGRELDSPLVALLADEVVKDHPGQEAVLDRLLDLLLIAVLRAWFARVDAAPPGWYRAHGDPIVGPALRLVRHRPSEPWTVASLAAEVGVSRATFARRFADQVGETPMAFLAGWRIALAADLLREPGTTLGSVAAQVGYGSPYALSAAFKRHRGMSPQQFRRRGAPTESTAA